MSHCVALKMDMTASEKYAASMFRVEMISVGVYMSRTARQERCVPDRAVSRARRQMYDYSQPQHSKSLLKLLQLSVKVI
jgi:hypothetical protein